MTRKTRRLIFYSSVAVFLVAGYLIILFALGYDYDFSNNKFVKTGSFQISANIGFEAYINNRQVGQSSFLSNSFAKKRLLPGSYGIGIRSFGYQDWFKNVDINAGGFLDFPNVITIKNQVVEKNIAESGIKKPASVVFNAENNDFEILSLPDKNGKITKEIIDLQNGNKKTEPQDKSTGVSSTLPAKRKDSLLLLISPDAKKQTEFNDHEVFVSWLEDSSYQPFKNSGDRELITRFSQKIDDLQWYKDSDHLLVAIGGVLKFVEIDTRGGVNIQNISDITLPFYYNRKTNLIYRFKDNQLVSLEFTK